jgi:copper chaperone
MLAFYKKRIFLMPATVIPIKGMSCIGCVNSVKNVLEKISGVSSVEVSLENAQAIIQHDTTLTNNDTFKKAIEGAGFEIREQ